MTDPTPGQITCQAWADANGNPVSFRTWDTLPELVREKWEKTAAAVLARRAGETGAPADPPPPVAADLTPAQCEALRRMAGEWTAALDAVRAAVDLLGARIHSAEDARIIAGAREALKVLEGAETPAGGPVPDDSAREPAGAQGKAQDRAGAKDGGEDEAPPGTCPTPCDPDCDAGCHESHKPVHRRWHDPGWSCGEVRRAIAGAVSAGRDAAEARIADLENTIRQATMMAESMLDAGEISVACARRLLSTLGDDAAMDAETFIANRDARRGEGTDRG